MKDVAVDTLLKKKDALYAGVEQATIPASKILFLPMWCGKHIINHYYLQKKAEQKIVLDGWTLLR